MDKLTGIIYAKAREMLGSYLHRQNRSFPSISFNEENEFEKENNKLYSIVMLGIIEYEKRNLVEK